MGKSGNESAAAVPTRGNAGTSCSVVPAWAPGPEADLERIQLNRIESQSRTFSRSFLITGLSLRRRMCVQ